MWKTSYLKRGVFSVSKNYLAMQTIQDASTDIIKATISDALEFATKNEPPKRPLHAVISSLQDHEKSIRSALKRGWTPTQLAGHLRKAGVKASENRLSKAIRDIAGLPPQKRRTTTKAIDGTTP
jgi:hypothetical protein